MAGKSAKSVNSRRWHAPNGPLFVSCKTSDFLDTACVQIVTMEVHFAQIERGWTSISCLRANILWEFLIVIVFNERNQIRGVLSALSILSFYAPCQALDHLNPELKRPEKSEGRNLPAPRRADPSTFQIVSTTPISSGNLS